MVCKSMVVLDMHNIQSAYKVRNYSIYNIFHLLLVEMMSNCIFFLPIWIYNNTIHILYQQYLEPYIQYFESGILSK